LSDTPRGSLLIIVQDAIIAFCQGHETNISRDMVQTPLYQNQMLKHKFTELKEAHDFWHTTVIIVVLASNSRLRSAIR